MSVYLNLASKMSSYSVVNFANSQLLDVIYAMNLNIVNRNLTRSE